MECRPRFLLFMLMIMIRLQSVFMSMIGFVSPVDVGMRMHMPVLVHMDQIAMAMFVAVHMSVLMGMLQFDRVPDHQHRRREHDCQAHIKLHARPFTEQSHSKYYAQKRRNGIIRAGLGRAQFLLCLDVKVDAQAVGHKASAITARIHTTPGIRSPTASATIRLPNPEKRPLIVVICTELLELSIRVQLFSNPQQLAAPSTYSEPALNAKLPAPSKLSAMLAAITKTTAAASLRPGFQQASGEKAL